jgi:erythronate-4-phosphate dehydrogenase
MLKILYDSQIPYIQDFFASHFILSAYHHQGEMFSLIGDCDILICRSTIKISSEMLQNTRIQLLASATSGLDHIDIQGLQKLKIPFIHAKGSNAHAVCDYITSTLAYVELHQYTKVQKIAVIGYGAVGKMVSNRLEKIGYAVFNIDPYVPTLHPITLHALSDMDMICLHPNYHLTPPFSTHHLMNQERIASLKKDVCIINASRGEVVDEAAILHRNFQGIYCTDVYKNEPDINPRIIERATLCTPHIAGHSLQSKWRMTSFIAHQIYQKYGFEAPEISPPTFTKPRSQEKTWQMQALAQYNPEIETRALKLLPTPEHFLKLRQQHRFREDFAFDI